MKKQFHLTKTGVLELKKELTDRMAQRPAIAERIKIAREFGDLAENAEYSSAMNEKEQNESRIVEIEHILHNHDVIAQPKNDSKIRLGSKVTLSGEDKVTKVFMIVGSVEADPLEGKVSDESPIGVALLGKKLGEQVEIKTPADTFSYKIVEIS